MWWIIIISVIIIAGLAFWMMSNKGEEGSDISASPAEEEPVVEEPVEEPAVEEPVEESSEEDKPVM